MVGELAFTPSAALPSAMGKHPAGPATARIHEIKHDGFRILARREGDRIRLFTRNGYDFVVSAEDLAPHSRWLRTARRTSGK